LTGLSFCGIINLYGELLMDEAQLKSLLETLADLSLEGETFQICHAALRLQTALIDHYQPD